MDRPVFDRETAWTEQAYLELPPGSGRIELADGALLVGPGTGDRRGHAVERVRGTVAAALPAGLRVVGPVPLRLGPDCVLVPDLVVTRALPGDGTPADHVPAHALADEDEDEAAAASTDSADEPTVLDAADALMVLEVVGAEHGSVDRSFKPQLYARSHIPYSLLVDHSAAFAVANMIIGGRYHEYARAEAGAVLRIEEPFGLEIDLRAVTREDHAEVRAAG